MSILKTALEAIETLLTDNTSEQAQAAAADARIKLANAMTVEPVLYQRRMKPDWEGGRWTAWYACSATAFEEVLKVPSLNDWTHQARALYLHPPQQAKQDTARLDWLEQNLFNRENLTLQGKVCKTQWMWVMFAPVGVQGSARTIIDAAMPKQMQTDWSAA